ncbi:MAG: hypothetical protein ACLUTA_18260 [Blautia wexlerae]
MDKAISSEVRVARAANKVSRKVQFLRCTVCQTAAGVAAALLQPVQYSGYRLLQVKIKLLFCSESERTVQEHSSQLYDFQRVSNQSICGGTSSLVQYISDFSSKLMNGGK